MSAAARAAAGKAEAARKAARRDSQSNGSLMRVSPIGVWARDPDTAARVAWQDSELSHPHPACAAAYAAYAAAIAAGIIGADRVGMLATAARIAEGHRATAPAIAAALGAARAGRRPESYIRNMGHVAIAFQNAFYHLAHTRDFEAALIDTIRQGGDTDTNAAIAGTLLGAAEERRAIPARWRTVVLGADPSRRSAHDNRGHRTTGRTTSSRWPKHYSSHDRRRQRDSSVFSADVPSTSGRSRQAGQDQMSDDPFGERELERSDRGRRLRARWSCALGAQRRTDGRSAASIRRSRLGQAGRRQAWRDLTAADAKELEEGLGRSGDHRAGRARLVVRTHEP
ncbi:MAG: ADP-ribosylglycohydrolase family protein, partial [Acidobacteria bacterium]|nr:ADP-ribosylglycohydrolase family protein [Acidobacteriota bacterium]